MKHENLTLTTAVVGTAPVVNAFSTGAVSGSAASDALLGEGVEVARHSSAIPCLFLACVWVTCLAHALAAAPLELTNRQPQTASLDASAYRVSAHDPVMIRQKETYYLFCTGWGVNVWSSKDMRFWKREKPVFSSPPAWAVEAVPTFKGHIWAPDISFHHGGFYLFYSVSAFGKNTSCIGVATNATLDPGDPLFKWVDCGKVIQSVPGVNNWNAIDPNLIIDDGGTPYLAFGSFWGGLQMARLASDCLRLAENADTVLNIASRKPDPGAVNPIALEGNPPDAGGNAIEAPFVFKHAGYYYLFASIDYCCRGAKSNYKMIVGRGKSVVGPFMDKAGILLDHGGGSLVLAGNAQWYGVGHNAVCTFDGTDYIVFHGYDASDRANAKLRIEKLRWDDDGWPVVDLKLSAPGSIPESAK